MHKLNILFLVVYRKTASLGEMIQQLAPLGVEVPGGFGVTSWAYDAVLDQNDLRERLTALLSGLDGKCISSWTLVVSSSVFVLVRFELTFVPNWFQSPSFKIWPIAARRLAT